MAKKKAVGADVEELIETKGEFGFDLAFVLFQAGHELVRKSKAEGAAPFTLAKVFEQSSLHGVAVPKFAILNEQGTLDSYYNLTNEDIFAVDWQVIK